ncbi:MAG: NADPH2:quinone reductase [Paracoccaceae bacterium]|jgi:NADPH2:quinone reductase
MRLHALGESLILDDIPAPEPGPGQVRLRLEACGVNFGDTLLIHGKYQEKPALPFSPGAEVCGVVDKLGEGVTGLTVGQRVAAMVGNGGFAEMAVASASACVPTPEGMEPAIAAAFLIAYGTSHVALEYRARLQPGERLMVLGAAGGVGLTAVEIGKLMGAEVIACARGADRLAICKQMGADHLIDTSSEDIKARGKELGGVDVVYDPVGGEQFRAALSACRPEARMIPLGFASGDIPQIPANLLLVKNIDVLGFYWGAYRQFKPKVLTDSIATLFKWWSEGKLHPHVSHTLPLAQAGEAIALLADRKATGKVVVDCTA